MNTWIALFRSINVGGRNILPMAELRRDLASLGLENVRSYIQSGNVVFESGAAKSASIAKKITGLVQRNYGFEPKVLIVDRELLLAAVEANPFPNAVAEPSTLHFAFLEKPPHKPDRQSLEAARAASESYELIDRVFYLHAPDGIARSKLAASAERYLGVGATSRNYRTVAKLLAMVSAPDT